MTATLRYTSSRHQTTAVRVARVAAASRIQAERLAREAARARYLDEGQLLSADGTYVEWCLICSRPTDHTGEHTPEQIAAWKGTR